jgi:hypothetical protein
MAIVGHYVTLGDDSGASNKKIALPAIHQAAVDNNIEGLKSIIKSGVRMETRLSDGSTPLVLAAKKGARDSVLYLVKAGANIGSSNHKKRTALHLAAREGHYQIVSDLLVFGADAMAKDKKGKEPIEHAVAIQSVEHSITFSLIEKFAAQPAFDYDNVIVHNQRIKELRLKDRIDQVLENSYSRINDGS